MSIATVTAISTASAAHTAVPAWRRTEKARPQDDVLPHCDIDKLTELTPYEETVIRLHYVERHSLSEIAESFGVHPVDICLVKWGALRRLECPRCLTTLKASSPREIRPADK